MAWFILEHPRGSCNVYGQNVSVCNHLILVTSWFSDSKWPVFLFCESSFVELLGGGGQVWTGRRQLCFQPLWRWKQSDFLGLVEALICSGVWGWESNKGRFDFRWSWKAIVSRTSACWPEAMPAAVQLAAVVVSSILLSMFLTAILQKQLKMFLISDQGLVWLNLLPFVSSVALVRLRSASPCPDKPCHPSGSVAAFVVCLIAPFNHQ